MLLSFSRCFTTGVSSYFILARPAVRSTVAATEFDRFLITKVTWRDFYGLDI